MPPEDLLADTAVIGIDCSARSTGVVYLTASGMSATTLIVPKKLREGARLGRIYAELKAFIDTGAARVPLVAGVIEDPSFNSTNRPFTIGEVHGVVKLLLDQYGIPLYGAAPKTLKKYGTGKGTADKAGMIEAALSYGCSSDQNDVCDAWLLAMMGLDKVLLRATPGTRAAHEALKKLSLK